MMRPDLLQIDFVAAIGMAKRMTARGTGMT
jgi:hypothetical protein